jgi:hypothetical protein
MSERTFFIIVGIAGALGLLVAGIVMAFLMVAA